MAALLVASALSPAAAAPAEGSWTAVPPSASSPAGSAATSSGWSHFRGVSSNPGVAANWTEIKGAAAPALGGPLRQGEGQIAPGAPHATPFFALQGTQPGPTVVVVAGVHGDEPAAVAAAESLRDLRLSRGLLVVIPRADRRAVEALSHHGPDGRDLGDSFPDGPEAAPQGELAEAVFSFIKRLRPQWVLDLHEGSGFAATDSGAVGESLIYYPGAGASSLATDMELALQMEPADPAPRFVQLQFPARGSLARAAAVVLGAGAVMVETSLDRPLEQRVAQQRAAVLAALRSLGML